MTLKTIARDYVHSLATNCNRALIFASHKRAHFQVAKPFYLIDLSLSELLYQKLILVTSLQKSIYYSLCSFMGAIDCIF